MMSPGQIERVRVLTRLIEKLLSVRYRTHVYESGRRIKPRLTPALDRTLAALVVEIESLIDVQKTSTVKQLAEARLRVRDLAALELALVGMTSASKKKRARTARP